MSNRTRHTCATCAHDGQCVDLHYCGGAYWAPEEPDEGEERKQVAEWLKKISDAETCPDSPRYKGCGNSWASNQPRWIVTRLLVIGEGIEPFTGEEL